MIYDRFRVLPDRTCEHITRSNSITRRKKWENLDNVRQVKVKPIFFLFFAESRWKNIEFSARREFDRVHFCASSSVERSTTRRRDYLNCSQNTHMFESSLTMMNSKHIDWAIIVDMWVDCRSSAKMWSFAHRKRTSEWRDHHHSAHKFAVRIVMRSLTEEWAKYSRITMEVEWW